MIRDFLREFTHVLVQELIASDRLPAAVAEIPIEISDTKSIEHGDFATNFAMISAKAAGMNPRAVATLVVDAFQAGPANSLVHQVEIAGPGFLNFRLDPAQVARYVDDILAAGDAKFGNSHLAHPDRINVEFVSVNPNGPITIGSGRGAAFGSVLCNVLEAAGNVVHREYYINDGVNSEQMRLFGLSVQAKLRGEPVPEGGYKGDYVDDIAQELKLTISPDEDLAVVKKLCEKLMTDRQREALEIFGITFDTWFSEQSLHDAGIVDMRLDELAQKGVADENPVRTKVKFGKGGVVEEVIQEAQVSDDDDVATGERATLWLRSTNFGDDQDRVLRRKDGRLTYIASDVAYHADKFNRPSNATKLITVLGPDHHGYIGRLHAVLAALLQQPGQPDADALRMAREQLQVVIFQLVRFMKDGKPAPMRKRDGNIYALIDLIDEIGKQAAPVADQTEQRRIGRDVARFFYLMRSHETAMDFDLDLATRQSDDNPVFYTQYAHARICSVIARASDITGEPNLSLLVHPRETALIKKICDLPYEIQRSAKDHGVNRLTTYAVDLAGAFHYFYDACRVVQPEEPELSAARLALCHAARVGLRATFRILGVSAPERMSREPSVVGL